MRRYRFSSRLSDSELLSLDFSEEVQTQPRSVDLSAGRDGRPSMTRQAGLCSQEVRVAPPVGGTSGGDPGAPNHEQTGTRTSHMWECGAGSREQEANHQTVLVHSDGSPKVQRPDPLEWTQNESMDLPVSWRIQMESTRKRELSPDVRESCCRALRLSLSPFHCPWQGHPNGPNFANDLASLCRSVVVVTGMVRGTPRRQFPARQACVKFKRTSERWSRDCRT